MPKGPLYPAKVELFSWFVLPLARLQQTFYILNWCMAALIDWISLLTIILLLLVSRILGCSGYTIFITMGSPSPRFAILAKILIIID
jgi:hypothetical protein